MSMRDQSRSAAAEEGSQIDLTPMLDVVFIMLIFFIVTSSFVKEPGSSCLSHRRLPRRLVSVARLFCRRRQRRYFLQQEQVALDRALRTAEAAKEAPQANIVVQVDRETPAYVVEDLIDIVRPILTAPPCISTDEEA